ncbi:MAG: HEAT repeat domain-containing protein [Planctomycetota bacterium]
MRASRSLPALLVFCGLHVLLGSLAVGVLWPSAKQDQDLADQGPRASDSLATAVPVPHKQAALSPIPDRVRSQAEVHAVVEQTQAMQRDDVPRLRRAALESNDPIVAGNAIRALGRLRAFAAEPDLLDLLDDQRPRVRQEAVMALGRCGDEKAVPRLVVQLDAEDPSLRALAIRALGDIGGVLAEKHLRTALVDAASEVERLMARQALQGLAERVHRMALPAALAR